MSVRWGPGGPAPAAARAGSAVRSGLAWLEVPQDMHREDAPQLRRKYTYDKYWVCFFRIPGSAIACRRGASTAPSCVVSRVPIPAP